MAYEKNTWQTGDVVTAAKLNNMENGIADALAINVYTAEYIGETLTAGFSFNDLIDDMENHILPVIFVVQEGDHGYFYHLATVGHWDEDDPPYTAIFVGGNMDIPTTTFASTTATDHMTERV